MAWSKSVPTPAIAALSAAALSVALAGCQRNEPLPAEKTLALIKPVARVEVSQAPASAPAATPPEAATPAPAGEVAPAPAASPAPVAATAPAATQPAAPAAAPKGGSGSRMVLGEINFDGSSTALPGDAAATIEAVANYVAANPGVRVEIATHADKAGEDLARQRAQAARTALVGGGAKEDQIAIAATTAGDGKSAQRIELLLGAAAPAASAAVGGAPPAAAGGTSKIDGNAIYDKTCVACHGTGVAGAPKVGDKAAWAPRLAGGLAALVQSALKGKGAMPPKGGNAALSEVDIKAAVEHMVSVSK